MNVSEVMKSRVATCLASDDMNRAAELMWEQDCGCVPVVDEQNTVIGMITDRDICMAAYFQGRPLREMKVEAGMAKLPLSCRAEDRIEEALRVMTQGRVRRLPVVDAANRVIGLLSLADAVQHACEMAVAKRQREADEILTALLSITEPRRQGDGLSIQPADRQRAVALPPRARDGASPRIEESARPR